MSDIAPKKSGMTQADRDRSMHLVELALDFAERPRRRGGDFLAKSGSAAGFSAAAAAAYDARAREDQATRGGSAGAVGNFIRWIGGCVVTAARPQCGEALAGVGCRGIHARSAWPNRRVVLALPAGVVVVSIAHLSAAAAVCSVSSKRLRRGSCATNRCPARNFDPATLTCDFDVTR